MVVESVSYTYTVDALTFLGVQNYMVVVTKDQWKEWS